LQTCKFFYTFSGIWRIFVPAFGVFLFRHLEKEYRRKHSKVVYSTHEREK